MEELLKTGLWTIIIPAVLGIGGYVMRSFVNRLDALEKRVQKTPDEEGVRLLVSDKLDPVREDIHELRGKIDRIFDLLLEMKTKG